VQETKPAARDGLADVITTASEAETGQAGRRLAARLVAGDVVLLSGDLGAGKTAFVRGMAEGLGIDPAEVSSPTFTLIQEYRGGRLPLFHVDLYRLKSIEVEDLGLDDEAMERGVTAIEWPDRLPRPVEGQIRVHIEHTGECERRLKIARDQPPERPHS
jgi:tRNA threonylcarbamoyladenosine biosynthesis protein TsaE